MTTTLPRPIANADSAPYWNAARSNRLLIRRCQACRSVHFMPRYLCPQCWSTELEWIEASGRGKVYSYSIVRRASDPAFIGRAPYVLAMIELEEGSRMMTNIVGQGALQVRIGDPVRVVFEERGEGDKIPQFELDNAQPAQGEN